MGRGKSPGVVRGFTVNSGRKRGRAGEVMQSLGRGLGRFREEWGHLTKVICKNLTLEMLAETVS